MICPNCGHEATMTECYATSVEKHGLDTPPYERFTDTWLECDQCGGRTETSESIRIMIDACLERAESLNDWEENFLRSIWAQNARFGAGSLTPKQRKRLEQVYREKIARSEAKR